MFLLLHVLRANTWSAGPYSRRTHSKSCYQRGTEMLTKARSLGLPGGLQHLSWCMKVRQPDSASWPLVLDEYVYP